MKKMEKISIITMIFCMFFTTMSFASTATVDVNSARLRQEANTTSNILTNIYKGEKVEILEKNGEWYKVKYGNNIGYLKDNLIKEDSNLNETNLNTQYGNNNSSSINEITENTHTDFMNITTNSVVNVRYQPNIMSNIITEIEPGKELIKKAEIGNWLQISDGTMVGWILKTKVNINQAQNNSTNIQNIPNNEENNSTANNSANNNENKVENNTKNNTNTVANQTNSQFTTTQINNVNKKGKVNVETAKVRSAANQTAKIVDFLDYNDEITIIAEEGEWYKITKKSIEGYVHKTLITLIEEETVSSRGTNEERNSIKENINLELDSNENLLEETANNIYSDKGQQVVNFAKKYLGYKYVVGGKNPESGFDCSGFTRYVFLQFGHSLGTTAASQNNLGVEVSRNELKSGDLILFYDEGKNKIGHTGIYINNGDFIHSANPERGVVIDNINSNSYYNERYIVGKRIVE